MKNFGKKLKRSLPNASFVQPEATAHFWYLLRPTLPERKSGDFCTAEAQSAQSDSKIPFFSAASASLR
ncbi:hypothetical protein D6779_07095 [Candidatus Parcubacteria bacterium]|nr:MAG: hypothetical protein D6779_07095 [Candidatus Parcubacteria bacterium]